jgi:hypothetical protein
MMASMAMKKMHQGAGEKQEIGSEAKCVCPVLPQEKESDDHSE